MRPPFLFSTLLAVGLLVATMPFEQDSRITVQVVNGLGNCWGAEFVSPAQVNTGARLMAKEKP